MTTKRKTFSKAFKEEAVRLLEQGNNSPADIARELGIKRNQLYKWQQQVHTKGEEAFPGKGRRTSADDEQSGSDWHFQILQSEAPPLLRKQSVVCGAYSRIKGSVTSKHHRLMQMHLICHRPFYVLSL